MTSPVATPPNWPRLAIRIDATAGTVTLDGTVTSVAGASLDDTRLHALEVAIEHSARVGRPLHCDATDPVSSRQLIVHCDGVFEPTGRLISRWWLVATLLLMVSLVAAGVGAGSAC